MTASEGANCRSAMLADSAALLSAAVRIKLAIEHPPIELNTRYAVEDAI